MDCFTTALHWFIDWCFRRHNCPEVKHINWQLQIVRHHYRPDFLYILSHFYNLNKPATDHRQYYIDFRDTLPWNHDVPGKPGAIWEIAFTTCNFIKILGDLSGCWILTPDTWREWEPFHVCFIHWYFCTSRPRFNLHPAPGVGSRHTLKLPCPVDPEWKIHSQE